LADVVRRYRFIAGVEAELDDITGRQQEFDSPGAVVGGNGNAIT
jgi:hypothetical protein